MSESFMNLKRFTLVLFLILVTFGWWPPFANSEEAPSNLQNQSGKKQFLLHVKTSLDKDDAQICVAPNVAWAALRKGHEVTLLFDGSAVTSVKRGGLFGSTKTGMDKAALPEREREALAKQFDTPLSEIPRNYGEYLGFLKNLGAKIFINHTMMVLYKIDPKDIDSNLLPVSLEKIISLMEGTDIYMVY